MVHQSSRYDIALWRPQRHRLPMVAAALAATLLTAVTAAPQDRVVPAPGGGSFLSLVEPVTLNGVTRLVLEEIDPLGDRYATFYNVDGAGAAILTARLPESVLRGSIKAFTGEMLLNESGIGARFFSLSNGLWTPGPVLPPVDLGAPLDLERTTFALSEGTTVSMYDVTSSRTLQFRTNLPLPGVRAVESLELANGAMVVSAAGNDPRKLYVSAFSGSFWPAFTEIQPPPGVDWASGDLKVDVDADHMIVGLTHGLNQPDRVMIFERSGGTYVYAQDLLSQAVVLDGSGPATPFGVDVAIDSQVAVVQSEFGSVVDRFDLVNGAWQAAARQAQVGSFHLEGQDVFYLKGGELRIPVRTGVSSDLSVVCSANGPPVALTGDWGLRLEAVDVEEPGSLSLDWSVDTNTSLTQLHLLVAALEPGYRVLGPSSALCFGGPIARTTMEVVGGFLATNAFATFDPAVIGVGAGSTLYFQAWRPEPGLSGGITSSALKVTFAP